MNSLRSLNPDDAYIILADATIYLYLAKRLDKDSQAILQRAGLQIRAEYSVTPAPTPTKEPQ